MKRILGNWRRRAAIAALPAVAALALAGVGGSALGAAGKPVTIANFKFHPGTLRIKAGGSVDFANDSKVTHTATDAGTFDTGRIAPGTAVLIKFNHRGTFSYHCTIHPFMHGKIVVE